MKNKANILIVEDEAIIYNRMRKVLQKEHYAVDEYTPSYDEAIVRIQQKRPDIVLLDINLQGAKTGLDLGKILSEKYHIPFIYVTEFDDNETFYKGLQTRHEQFIVKTKPRLNPTEIIRAIQTVLNKRKDIDYEKKGIIGLVDYLEEIKKFSKGAITRVPVPYEEIAFFTNKPFINDNDEEEKLRANYIWFLTKKKDYFFLKKSLKEVYETLPHYFVRVNENYLINILPEILQGRINGTRVSVLGHEINLTGSYMTEFQKRLDWIYNN